MFPGGGLCLSHRECEIPNPFSPALELSETPRASPVPRTSRTPWSLDARELAGRWIPELVTQGRRARALAAGDRLALGPLRPPPVLPDLHGALHREFVPRLQGGASQAESRLSFGCGVLRCSGDGQGFRREGLALSLLPKVRLAVRASRALDVPAGGAGGPV